MPDTNANPNPNSAGAAQTSSGNHVISISGGKEKQVQERKKKKKEKNSRYELEPSSPCAAECGVRSSSPKRIEDECQGSKGLRSGALPGDSEMSIEEIEGSMGDMKSKITNNKRHLEGNWSLQNPLHPCYWYLSRRALWNLFHHQSPWRRQRRIRASLRRRGNKITKTADNNCLQNQGQFSDRKRLKTDKTADARDSSVSVQRESITKPEKDSSEDYCKPPDVQPLQRPPKPEEDGVWAPTCVKTNSQGMEKLLYGEPMVEIFNIEVDLRRGTKKHGNIHGNIMLQCGSNKIVLFNCDKKNALMIKHKGSLPLKGPDVATVAFDSVGVFVNLKIDDVDFCKDVVVWDPCYGSTDVWLYHTLEGRNGFVKVTFAVMKQACLAELGVKLMKSGIAASSSIYGDIVVYINNMPYLRYFAFSKEIDDCSIVKPLESIPLSRSLFSCRCGSSLVVKVDLRDSDTKESLACGALLFPPEYYGDSVGRISGSCGMVKVKVNWVFYRNHLKTRQAYGLDH